MKHAYKARLATLLVVVALVGCSAGSDEGDDTRESAGPGGPSGAGVGGGSGVGGGAGSGGDGSFDNGSGFQPIPMVDASTECEVGSFCENTEPDPTNCGSLTLEGEVETIENPGNVLLIFDRSGSMDNNWNGQKRWEAAGTAIINALTPIADKVTVGAVFFPSPDAQMGCAPGDWLCGITGGFVGSGNCAVNPISSTDQINFMPGPQFLDAFDGDPANNVPPMYAPVNGGSTPLMDGVVRAQEALAGASLTGKVTTVIITDGAPNCGWNADTTNQVVTTWASSGVPTHVVGLPGSDGGGQVLTSLAMLGGTNTYLTPTDTTLLQQELSKIVMQTVSVGFKECTIQLNPPADVPEDLHMVVSEGGAEQDMPRTFGTGEQAWTVSSDGAVVELLGNVCDAAKTSRYEQIRFEFGCVELPPAPPPPPIDVE